MKVKLEVAKYGWGENKKKKSADTKMYIMRDQTYWKRKINLLHRDCMLKNVVDGMVE